MAFSKIPFRKGCHVVLVDLHLANSCFVHSLTQGPRQQCEDSYNGGASDIVRSASGKIRGREQHILGPHVLVDDEGIVTGGIPKLGPVEHLGSENLVFLVIYGHGYLLYGQSPAPGLVRVVYHEQYGYCLSLLDPPGRIHYYLVGVLTRGPVGISPGSGNSPQDRDEEH